MGTRLMQPLALKVLAGACVASLCILSGCHGPLNSSNQLLGTQPLPALEPSMPRPVASTDVSAIAGSMIAPLDRSESRPIVVQIQCAQVEHEPTYRSFEPLIPSSARARDAWPTPESALSCEVDDGAAALDGLVEPFRPMVELVLAPISIIVTPPFTVQVAPAMHGPLQPADQYDVPWRWVRSPGQSSDAITTQEDLIAWDSAGKPTNVTPPE